MEGKQEFLTALNQLPEGLAGFDTRAVPTLASTSRPSDVESAIVTQGILAHNLNMILRQFEGMYLVELFLRISQRNPVMQSILLAGLEYVQYVDFQVVAPSDGGTYQGYFSTFQVQIARNLEQVTKVEVAVNEETLELTGDESGMFSGDLPLAIGTYTATITVVLGSSTQTQTVNFAVTHFDTIPEEGQTYTIAADSDFEIKCFLPPDVASEDVGELDFQPIASTGYHANFSYNADSHMYSAYITPIIFGIGATQGSWTWKFKGGTVVSKVVNYFVDPTPTDPGGE